MLLYIIYLIGGILIGCIISAFFWVNYIRAITYGTLRQAHDEDETYLFLELDRRPEDIKKWDQVVFKVNKNDFNTQE